MSDQAIAQLLRNSLDVNLQSWKDERAKLLTAPARIAELEELIAFVENDNRTSMTVAPRGNGNGNGGGNGNGNGNGVSANPKS